MTTASTCSPSCSRTSSLVVVPSWERWHASSVLVERTKRCSSTACAALGSAGTSTHSALGWRSKCLYTPHRQMCCGSRRNLVFMERAE